MTNPPVTKSTLSRDRDTERQGKSTKLQYMVFLLHFSHISPLTFATHLALPPCSDNISTSLPFCRKHSTLRVQTRATPIHPSQLCQDDISSACSRHLRSNRFYVACTWMTHQLQRASHQDNPREGHFSTDRLQSVPQGPIAPFQRALAFSTGTHAP
jgi:hypothetical protein